MNFQCPKCDFNGHPHLSETGPHTKATCPDCGAYIKMVSRSELETLVPIETEEPAVEVTFTIKTIAPENCHPEILNRVKESLEAGFTSGEGNIESPFDKHPYHYDFYYK